MTSKRLIACVIVLVLVASTLAFAQFGGRGRRGGGGFRTVKRPEHITWTSDFTFCRIAYAMSPDGDGGGWGVDYPRADENLPIRLSELTRTPVNFDSNKEVNHVVIQASEPALFQCPFVMMSEYGSAYI